MALGGYNRRIINKKEGDSLGNSNKKMGFEKIKSSRNKNVSSFSKVKKTNKLENKENYFQSHSLNDGFDKQREKIII